MYFFEKTNVERYREELNREGVLLMESTIQAYYGVEWRKYAYKDEETKLTHIEKMKQLGWEDNEGKQKELIYGSIHFGGDSEYILVNEFRIVKEIDQSKF